MIPPLFPRRPFSSIRGIDRHRPVPYPARPTLPQRAAERQIRAWVDALGPDGVDDHTGAALDPLTWAWAAGRLAALDGEYADHTATVERLIGAAQEQLAVAEARCAHTTEQLALARADFLTARDALTDEEIR